MTVSLFYFILFFVVSAQGNSPADVRTSSPTKNEASFNAKGLLALKIWGAALLILV